ADGDAGLRAQRLGGADRPSGAVGELTATVELDLAIHTEVLPVAELPGVDDAVAAARRRTWCRDRCGRRLAFVLVTVAAGSGEGQSEQDEDTRNGLHGRVSCHEVWRANKTESAKTRARRRPSQAPAKAPARSRCAPPASATASCVERARDARSIRKRLPYWPHVPLHIHRPSGTSAACSICASTATDRCT